MKRLKLDFDFSKTIETQQCPSDFWYFENGVWITFIPPFGKLIVKDFEDFIEYKFIGNNFGVKRYFEEYFMRIPYEEIEREFSEDKNVLELLKNREIAVMFDFNKEYRILEVVLTQNTNIKRIKEMQRLLFRSYGKVFEVNGEKYFGFPEVEKIAKDSEGEIRRKIMCGYRARYLKEIAEKLSSKEIDIKKIERMKTEDARAFLMSFKGIGLKTADLILFHAFKRFDTFPIDVHVKRWIEKKYFDGKEQRVQKIHEFALEYFGEYAGFISLLVFSQKRTPFWNVNLWTL